MEVGKPESDSDPGPQFTAPRTSSSTIRRKILPDSFARALAGFSSDNEFLAAVGLMICFSRFRRASQRSFALRNRYAEDQLAAAVASGTAQYVILGAGPRLVRLSMSRRFARIADFRG